MNQRDPHPPGDDPPDDDLVAYLDGELPEAEAKTIESRLALDPAARKEADALKKTYDLLDFLPKPEPSATFASRTMTQIDAPAVAPSALNGVPVRAASSTAVESLPPRRRGWLPALAWTAAALVAGGLGYVGHLLARPHLDAPAKPPQTSQQVRLLERLPYYLGVDDLAFLKQLDDHDLFGEADSEAELAAKPAPPADTLSAAELARLEDLFDHYPPARQQQLRQLDDDFHALDAPLRDKLTGTLERYAVWLDHLPDAYRREILSVPAAPERLVAVRQVKVRLWRESLPATIRAKLNETADPEERDRLLADWRKQEADRRRLWTLARKQWANRMNNEKPWPFDAEDGAKPIDDFVARILRPRLRSEEAVQLDDLRKDAAQNGGYLTWYLYGATVARLAEAHPSLPEPKLGKPLTTVDELPKDVLNRLRLPGAGRPQAARRELKDAPQHGKWPEFAELVVREARDRNVPFHSTQCPSRPGEFKPEVDAVLEAVRKKLSAKEAEDFNKLEGKWPEYPRQFVELARKQDLPVPGVTLPGAPSLWARTYQVRGKKI